MVLLRLIADSISFAFSSLINNKLRTFLSLLGITIGIFCIISVMSAIDSIERSLMNSFESLGGDNIFIQKWPWGTDEEFPWWKYVNRPYPKMWEADRIEELSHTAGNVVFMAYAQKPVSFEDKTLNHTFIRIASHDFDKVESSGEIARGRYFSQFESNSGSNVAIIGDNILEKLFSDIDPVGKQIKINGRKVTVVGVFKKTGTAFSNGMDNAVLIPLNFGKRLFDVENGNSGPCIIVKPKRGISTEMMIDEVTVLMRNIRKIRPVQEDNFALNQSSMITRMFDRIFAVLDIAGIIIGGFSILVGGFGIANIMFVSVKERTKQIGIQKAIGAKSYLILIQFLTESIVLCLVGGIVGLILVALLMLVISSAAPFEFVLSIQNIITGTLISVIIGIVSGYAPARKAAKLNPVIAINHI